MGTDRLRRFIRRGKKRLALFVLDRPPGPRRWTKFDIATDSPWPRWTLTLRTRHSSAAGYDPGPRAWSPSHGIAMPTNLYADHGTPGCSNDTGYIRGPAVRIPHLGGKKIAALREPNRVVRRTAIGGGFANSSTGAGAGAADVVDSWRLGKHNGNTLTCRIEEKRGIRWRVVALGEPSVLQRAGAKQLEKNSSN